MMSADAPPQLVRESLHELHARPPLGEYLRQVWARREFAIRVAQRDFRARNMGNVLGLLWFLLNPALSILVYYVFFGLVLGTDRGVDNFIAFLAVGIFAYQFMQKSLTSAGRTIVSNLGVIRAIRFPRALLPLSDVIGQTLVQLPVIGVVYFVALVTGEIPDPAWVLLVPITVAQAVFVLGFGLVMARLTTVFRDLQNFLPYAFRLVFYASGVIFSVDAYIVNPLYQTLFLLNPFYDFIAIARWALLGISVSGWVFVAAAAWTAVALPIGVTAFWRGEPYGRA